MSKAKHLAACFKSVRVWLGKTARMRCGNLSSGPPCEAGPATFAAGVPACRRAGRQPHFWKEKNHSARSWAFGIYGLLKRSSMDRSQPPGRRWHRITMNRRYQLPATVGTPPKLIKNAGGCVGADRLGSIGHFYPWGQEKPLANTEQHGKSSPAISATRKRGLITRISDTIIQEPDGLHWVRRLRGCRADDSRNDIIRYREATASPTIRCRTCTPAAGTATVSHVRLVLLAPTF